jgi:DHA1 family inner membrane transport protein
VDPPTTKPRIRGIVLFGVLLASYAINAMDRQLFPLLVPEVRRQYGFSLAGVGFLSTVFTLGMALAGLPTGYLLVRLSRKTVMQVGIALFSAGTLLTILARGFSDMLIYRAATGIGEAMQLTVLIAIAVNYFVHHRSTALGAINFTFGLGAIASPILGGALLTAYRNWHAPMAAFGLLGFLAMAAIALVVDPWFTESVAVSYEREDRGGAATLVNRNTMLLTVMSLIGGLVIYGYLGMYPTFLREDLHYSPTSAGTVMSFYGLGALGSLAGGWVGDRFSPRLVLSSTFFCAAALGYLLFHRSGAIVPQAILSFLWGLIVSGVIYVNLAGYHAKALQSSLASRASGIFVTSLYGSAAFAGYLVGWIATHAGWATAGEIQISLLSVVAGGLGLALRPNQMS